MTSKFDYVTPESISEYIAANAERPKPNVITTYPFDPRGMEEVSFFAGIDSFDVALKEGKYIAQPNIWLGKRRLFPLGLRSIPEKFDDEDYILVLRRRGQLSIDRIVSGEPGDVWGVRRSEFPSIVSVISREGYLALDPVVVDKSDSDNVMGIFSLVDTVNILK